MFVINMLTEQIPASRNDLHCIFIFKLYQFLTQFLPKSLFIYKDLDSLSVIWCFMSHCLLVRTNQWSVHVLVLMLVKSFKAEQTPKWDKSERLKIKKKSICLFPTSRLTSSFAPLTVT